MHIFVIGHPEAVQGFALAGVKGLVAETKEVLNSALDIALQDEDIGILLITSASAGLARTRVDALKKSYNVPLILEIPDPSGMDPNKVSLTGLANKAIGISR